MPDQGRSVDDLPLAAYLTGVVPEIEPASVESTASASAASLAGSAVHPGVNPSGHDLLRTPFAESAGAANLAADATARPALRDLLRNPRGNLRDPRLLLSGVIAIGVVLLALSLFGGGVAKGPNTALASATPPAGPVVTAAPVGDASVAVTGAVTGTFILTGQTGTGRASGSAMDSSWGDPLGDLLALSGPVSSGTRATDDGFVLSWTLLIKGVAVPFASKAGECTIGMADKVTSVTGSFFCKKVKSADGKFTVVVQGTYRT